MSDLRSLAYDNPAPEILDPDLEEQIFAHRSLYTIPSHVQILEEEPRDWERLAFLGDQVLSMAVTDVVIERYPYARTSYLTSKRNFVVNNKQIARWSQAYGFHKRIRAHPAQQTVIASNEGSWASVLEAYIGAVERDSGYQRADHWLKPLIRAALDESDAEERQELQSGPSPPHSESRSEIYIPDEPDTPTPSQLDLEPDFQDLSYRTEIMSLSPDDSISSAPQRLIDRAGSNTPRAQPSRFNDYFPVEPEPFAHAREPARQASRRDVRSELKFRSDGGSSTASPIPNPSPNRSSPSTKASHSSRAGSSAAGSNDSRSSPHQSSSTRSSANIPLPTPASAATGYLALFNQLAAQKHIDPRWQTSSSGPAHRPIFEARLYIGDQLQGEGRAYNKQTAKHAAAEKALKKLKWHTE